MTPCSISPVTLSEALENGAITLQGRFLLGSNYTFLVQVHYQGRAILAVYKPQAGERPLWDFPPGSLGRREVAAYLLSELLGLHLVPCTVLREGPFGPGVVQQFIPHRPEYHYFAFTEEDRQRLRPVVLFDILANNADRKGSHVLIEKRTRRLYAIDHGLCFHEEEKLRTVFWDFAGEPIAENLLRAVRPLLSTDCDVFTIFQPYLSHREIAALRERAQALLANPVFPHPPKDRRVFPYPPF